MSEPLSRSSVLVCYQGMPAALVGRRRLSFLGELRSRPPGDPDVRIVAHMAYYAQLVLNGEMPTPYQDEDAERFARLALIEPDRLSGSDPLADARLAAELRVPVEQLTRARRELADQ